METGTFRISRILSITYPVLLGYVSVGFVFGVLARAADHSVAFAALTSIGLFAGAAQFLLLRLIQSSTPLIEIFLAVFLLNLRHIFYYKPVQKKLPPRGPKSWYTIFAMTDESFALLTEDNVRAEDSFWILLFNQAYWVAGTVMGAFFGVLLASQLEGLDFSLLALFLVLLLEKIRFSQDKSLLSWCLAVCLVGWLLFPPQFFLILSILLSFLIIGCRARRTDV